MVQISSFRGIHFNLETVNLDEVTTPPYDIIDKQAQEYYYEKSPFSIIRLDLGKTKPQDSDVENRYTRAADTFSQWQKNDVLVRDNEPSLYVYRQTYEQNPTTKSGVDKSAKAQVTGMICLVELEELGRGVLPHEKTLSAPKKDRRQLLEACRANFSPVFALFSDSSGVVSKILNRSVSDPSLMTTSDEAGTTHEIVPLTDPKRIGAIIDALKTKKLFIADGHHRYETSLNYLKSMVADGWAPSNSQYIMMYLVDMANEDLTVLPTHRVLNIDGFSLDDFLSNVPSEYKISRGMALDDIFQPNGSGKLVTFGLYAGGEFLRLEAQRSSLIGDQDLVSKRLDTSLLQETIFGPLLNIAGGDPRLSFTQKPEEAVKLVDSKQASLAVLVRATDIEHIVSIAEAGEKMPQKSTFFYPKPRTGLILNKLD